MILRSRHARRHGRTQEMDLTTFINLMVVLVSFLLVTAVYSRISIHELNLPGGAPAASSEAEQPLNLTVNVMGKGFIVTDRAGVVAEVLLKDAAYDYGRLGEVLQAVKARVPAEKALTLRVGPKIPYDVIIQVMDVARLPVSGYEGFPDISIGDAPADEPAAPASNGTAPTATARAGVRS